MLIADTFLEEEVVETFAIVWSGTIGDDNGIP